MISIRHCLGVASVLKNIHRLSLTFSARPISIGKMATKTIQQRFENIVKPNEDKRKYLGLKLTNDLKVLLISDPETDISAASLSVNVGSMSDPWEIQGLAHFLEHMLFMGTKKYPNENEYSKFLSQHGGNSNAYTADGITNFFFDIAPEYLAPSLDRFAQFFIEPLMLESSVNRELEAVNSEFEKNIKSDSWRSLQIKKSLGSPKHDFYKFNIGNYETLRDLPNSSGINIRDELFKFYEQWYSANTMCLCVYGKETAEELTEMVSNLFTSIKNKNIKSPNWTIHPYGADSLMKQVYLVPIKEKRTLELVFTYPDEIKHYKSSPGMYLSHLIGHESKGSLLSELKRLGLSSALLSYFNCNEGFGFFHINVDLTEDAMNRIDDVIILIFQYINMLKENGPKQYIFEENKGLNYIKFHFMEKCNPIDYVAKISSDMHYYPIEDVLSANYLIDQFKPDLITEHIDYLKPENCIIAISSKSFEGQTDRKEKYYGTDYKIIDMGKDLIEKLKNPSRNENLKFPEPNEFIPTDFNIIKCNEPNTNVPKLLNSNEYFRVWHLHDQTYVKPKVFYAFKLINPIVYSNPYNVNINSLFAMLFKDDLTEFLYDAELAGLSFNIRSTVNGFDMEFFGYNHKMNVFLRRIFEKLIQFKPTEQRFEILKEKYARNLRNYKTQPLYYLTSYYLKSVTSELFWSYDHLIEALDRMEISSINNLMQAFFTNFLLEAFFHGNIDKGQVSEIMDFIQNNVIVPNRSVPLHKYHQAIPREIVLEPGCSYSYEVINDIQKPKAISIYYQVSFDNINDISKLLLIEQILSDPCFDYLRTKEQLGYVVYTKLREFSGVYGLIFVIQSDYNVSYLEDRIEAFIDWAKKHFTQMSEDEFNTEKQSLITRLLKKKKRLHDYSAELWGEISKEQYRFEKNKKYVDNVKELNREDISSFFIKHFAIESPERKKIMIQIIKSDSEANKTLPPINDSDLLPAPPKKESILIKNVEEFTKYKSLYPLPKPKTSTTTTTFLVQE
ncbi:insulin-degrading enzyme-like protein [Dermatophagoides farinae]|uniref:Insulin-degrading enzyme-like protein n=1 Tax=Dermatophagoides farinae TaxID=6954 RepID=A0A9D4NZH2_DERFA|nr:insulin-degrading enzyme-like [Dermatophagoides farinae]KAH7641203.1 insulin-degrading enzyme-like protein [Dermatophagoides farinae]